jgi:cell division protease FtsH
MFQGVAAARIRSLFSAARKHAPSIIFIDEIDAIGKARDSGPADSGSAEREQGLLQLLTEMDGFHQGDQVLIVAATNRAAALDDALLRPGRFDRTIHMGRPSPANRLRILQVHARGKPIDRAGDDALLATVADLTIGYSGAELANLLNEAAILAVRERRLAPPLRAAP